MLLLHCLVICQRQQRRKFLLKEISYFLLLKHVDENLNPKKRHILYPSRENFEIIPEIFEILNNINIKENEYYRALSISSDTDFQNHLRHMPNSCFLKNYFAEGLRAWTANTDIQPGFSHHKAVTYVCSYFSKAEDETSEVMKQAAREAFISGKSDLAKMKAIAKAYTLKQECSVQEAVYLLMPELIIPELIIYIIYCFHFILLEMRNI